MGGVAFGVAVVLRIGVEQHARRAALLGQVDLDAAEVSAVADKNDFAAQIDVQGGDVVEVFLPAVVGVDDSAVMSPEPEER